MPGGKKSLKTSLTAGGEWLTQEMPQFFLLGGSLFVFLFYVFNVLAQSNLARDYIIMAIASLVLIFGSKIINFTKGKGGKAQLFDPIAPLSGENKLDPSQKIKMYYGWIGLALFLMTFIIFAVKIDYAVASPDFAVVDLGMWGDLLLKGVAALTENFFFFISLNMVLVSLFGYYSRNPMLTEILSWAGCVAAFMVYHISVYGLEQFSTVFMLAIFGLEMLFWIKIWGEPNFAHVRHVANNVMKGIMDKYGLSVFVIQTMINPIFWILIMIIAVVGFARYRSSRKPGADFEMMGGRRK